jgi:hypothetical protein
MPGSGRKSGKCGISSKIELTHCRLGKNLRRSRAQKGVSAQAGGTRVPALIHPRIVSLVLGVLVNSLSSEIASAFGGGQGARSADILK